MADVTALPDREFIAGITEGREPDSGIAGALGWCRVPGELGAQ